MSRSFEEIAADIAPISDELDAAIAQNTSISQVMTIRLLELQQERAALLRDYWLPELLPEFDAAMAEAEQLLLEMKAAM